MGATPTNSTSLQKSPCGSTTSSDCIMANLPAFPCLNICSTDSVRDAMFKIATALCGVTFDATELNFGCMWQPYIGHCAGQGVTWRYDPTAPDGKGYCITCTTPPGSVCGDTGIAPTYTTNPVPAPSTVYDVLQLIIDNTSCCNSCPPILK